MKAEILYESEGKTPDGNPFLTVKEARNYYQYSERGGVDSIAFILYKKVTDSNNKKGKFFALINEAKPPLDEREGCLAKRITAFGGSIDSDKERQEICRSEVMEESGYEVSLDDITFIGETMVSTQMSQLCSLYLVDVTGKEKTLKAEYEDTDENVIWMTSDEVMDNNDWKSIFILSKSIVGNII